MDTNTDKVATLKNQPWNQHPFGCLAPQQCSSNSSRTTQKYTLLVNGQWDLILPLIKILKKLRLDENIQNRGGAGSKAGS
jgi:hypothetical protein